MKPQKTRWNHKKPDETTKNQMKPQKTRWNHTENEMKPHRTRWNHTEPDETTQVFQMKNTILRWKNCVCLNTMMKNMTRCLDVCVTKPCSFPIRIVRAMRCNIADVLRKVGKSETTGVQVLHALMPCWFLPFGTSRRRSCFSCVCRDWNTDGHHGFAWSMEAQERARVI